MVEAAPGVFSPLAQDTATVHELVRSLAHTHFNCSQRLQFILKHAVRAPGDPERTARLKALRNATLAWALSPPLERPTACQVKMDSRHRYCRQNNTEGDGATLACSAARHAAQRAH